MPAFMHLSVVYRGFSWLRAFASIALLTLLAESTGLAASGPNCVDRSGSPALRLLSMGEWASIVDPYFSGLFSFHHEEKKNGYFMNYKAKPGDPFPTEYDYSKAPKLKVPGDWNTQRESLMFYEGPVWYEKDFAYEPKPHTHIFLHVGAANYRSWFWVNGQKVCEHEGGFTSFNCEITQAVHSGNNFVVAAVDNTRREDNVPTLETDWWNYGGLTREVSLIEVPEYLYRSIRSASEPHRRRRYRRMGACSRSAAGEKAEVEIPDLQAKSTAEVGADGRATLHFNVKGLERWSPETPKLYKVTIRAGQDSIDELMGFRTIEVRGHRDPSEWQADLPAWCLHSRRSALSHRSRLFR